MGLDLSHGDFSMAYSAFNRLRQAALASIGGSWPPHHIGLGAVARGDWDPEDVEPEPELWYWGDGYSHETHPGLSVFFSHSDCDGEIGVDDCTRVADELEAILPQVGKVDSLENGNLGHLVRYGGYVGAVKAFITACRCAARKGEPLRFR